MAGERLTHAERQAVWGKTGGICYYCGCDLPKTGWHADHVAPVVRGPNGMERPHNHRIDGIVPSCAPCNLFKATMPVEMFREQIAAQVERARRSSVNFRTAERFGLIEVTNNSVVFWFETPTNGTTR